MSRKHYYIEKVDKHIGDKVYSLRLGKGLSREQLAEKINVSQQQLTKYEKGDNRISMGRLILIAKALDSTVEYFYEGIIDSISIEPRLTQHQRMCIEVSRNFMKIHCSEHQEAVSKLIKALIARG